MRYLAPHIKSDLKSKMVLIAGPRQCGKTTLAQSLMDEHSLYLNWDITKDRKIIREQSWPKNASLLILDELHKAPKWKNLLKAIADEFKNRPPVLVTGSARLDTFRKSGDALTGRHFLYRLHPIDLKESALFLPNTQAEERLHRLLTTGGFPEAFLNPKQALRLRKDRMELVLKEDLMDLTKVTAWRSLTDLVELLRDRVGRPIQYASLAQDLSKSAPTIKSWVEILERLYIVFTIPPFAKTNASSIRKERRVFFYDCGAAYDDTGGAQLENLVACCLLKHVQLLQDTTGENWGLHYLRDKQKREVDFVITKNRKIEKLIEIKTGSDQLSTSLKYYHDRLNPKESLQLVKNLDRPLEKSGIQILPLIPWLEKL